MSDSWADPSLLTSPHAKDADSRGFTTRRSGLRRSAISARVDRQEHRPQFDKVSIAASTRGSIEMDLDNGYHARPADRGGRGLRLVT